MSDIKTAEPEPYTLTAEDKNFAKRISYVIVSKRNGEFKEPDGFCIAKRLDLRDGKSADELIKDTFPAEKLTPDNILKLPEEAKIEALEAALNLKAAKKAEENAEPVQSVLKSIYYGYGFTAAAALAAHIVGASPVEWGINAGALAAGVGAITCKAKETFLMPRAKGIKQYATDKLASIKSGIEGSPSVTNTGAKPEILTDKESLIEADEKLIAASTTPEEHRPEATDDKKGAFEGKRSLFDAIEAREAHSM